VKSSASAPQGRSSKRLIKSLILGRNGGRAGSKRGPHERHAGHRQSPIAAIGYYPFKNRRWFFLERMLEEFREKPPV
jgi:hypothetical protein